MHIVVVRPSHILGSICVSRWLCQAFAALAMSLWWLSLTRECCQLVAIPELSSLIAVSCICSEKSCNAYEQCELTPCIDADTFQSSFV